MAVPDSTVVVVTWRGATSIAGCLDALAAQTRPHRLLVVDNASTDGTSELLAAHPCAPTVLRLPRNAGYAGGLAAALPRIDTPFMAWLNDDAVPEPDWLARCEDTMRAAPRTAAVSAALLRTDGAVQSLGVALTADGHGRDLRTADGSPPEVFGFCGGAALLRTAVLRAVGGVPACFFCYYEDTDTSWRLRLAGWQVRGAPEARVWHAHGASSRLGSAAFHRWNERNRLLMLLRCAPLPVAAHQVLRFAALTAVLGVRRLRGIRQNDANFHLRLRLPVLGAVLAGMPAALHARRTVRGDRRAVWRGWAGRRP